MSNLDSLSVPLFLEEQKGRKRVKEPVSVGVPFPKGMVFEPSRLVLMDADGGYHPVQTQPLAFWFDGSAKWVLLDFRADVEANAVTKYLLRSGSEQPSNGTRPTLSVRETSQGVIVDTGKAAFFLNRNLAKPFDRVVVGEVDLISEAGSTFVLTDKDGREHIPHIHDFAIEASGPLRANIKAEGEFKAGSGAGFARFVMRLSFYANSDIVEIRLTLHNPRAARHPGGLWDLGDEGSIYFKDLSIQIPLRSQTVPGVAWTTDTLPPAPDTLVTDLEIYQDSSGGENWLSTNHVNRLGEVKHSFRGYRVTTEGSQIESGLRATPILSITGEHGSVVATIDRFWQNFPKALEARGNELVLRLFPRQYNDLFELQGGEQKTHTAYLGFSDQGVEPADLAWTHERLAPRATAEWYAASKACSYLSPLSLDPNLNCQGLIDGAISGSQSFFARRETIDEYGWRHFGDLYADHEAVGHTGETPLVAHYNNQYDVLHGAIIEYLRGSDLRWFELASDLARHVIDIDIYHTQEDRAGYNGGLFWHTDHYLDSGTATHRTYSKANLKFRDPSFYGGGPSNEQNYTSGLLHYYYLTGDQYARDSVLDLADWVINMDDGSRRFIGFIDRRPTGLASSTASRDYHGPGRGAGNSINALLDAHMLRHQQDYWAKAEQLIRRCIHPDDNIEERNLRDPEYRWSYLVFLQVLGKYLEIKNGEKRGRPYVWVRSGELAALCRLDVGKRGSILDRAG